MLDRPQLLQYSIRQDRVQMGEYRFGCVGCLFARDAFISGKVYVVTIMLQYDFTHGKFSQHHQS